MALGKIVKVAYMIVRLLAGKLFGYIEDYKEYINEKFTWTEWGKFEKVDLETYV